MNKNLKYGLLIGGGVIGLATIVVIAKNKVRKAKLNKPCVGKKCAKGIEGKVLKLKDSFVNVRSSASIDNKNYWSLDFTDNLIGKVYESPLGTVKGQTLGSDGYVWYEVNLYKSLNGKQIGYVREDVVTL